jgi:hypothetical protein
VATSTYQYLANLLAPGDKTADQDQAKTEDATKAKVAKNEIADPHKLQSDSWTAPVTQFLKKAEDVVRADGSLIVNNLYDEISKSAPVKAVTTSVNAWRDEVFQSAPVKAVTSGVNALRDEVSQSAPVKTASDLYTEAMHSATAKAIGDVVTQVSNSQSFKVAENVALSVADPFAALYTTARATFFDDKQNLTSEQLDQSLQVESIDSKLNPEFISNIKAGVDQAFDASYAKADGSSGTLTAEARDLAAQRDNALKAHKPGTQWFEQGKLYQLSSKGDLLIYTDENNLQWIGQDGGQYEKKNGEQTWRRDGREIKADQGVYTYRAADGSYKVIDGNAKTLVEKIGGVLMSFTAKSEVSIDMTRGLVMKYADGVHGHGNAMAVLKTDASGNRILLDSLFGVYVFAKNGKNYHLDRDGSLYEMDDKGGRHRVQDLPGVLTREADGTFRFGTIKIEKDGSFRDSDRDLSMVGNTVTWKDKGHTYKEVLENGLWHEYVDGKTTIVGNTKTGEINVLENGKSVLNYNFESKKMHAFGITFSPEGTRIDGADFSISNAGVINFDNGEVWQGGASANSLSTKDASVAASGAVSDVLGLAASISGKAASEITEADVGLLVDLYMQLGSIAASLPPDAATATVVAGGMQSLASKLDALGVRAIVNENMRERGLTATEATPSSKELRPSNQASP